VIFASVHVKFGEMYGKQRHNVVCAVAVATNRPTKTTCCLEGISKQLFDGSDGRMPASAWKLFTSSNVQGGRWPMSYCRVRVGVNWPVMLTFDSGKMNDEKAIEEVPSC
jgi:hypothetical protein